MPRVSRDQLEWAVPIPREQLLVGDLVFFNEPVDHVAIYAGDGRIVDASSARAGVVERPLWRAAVVRYGRVPRPGMPAVLPWSPPPPPVASSVTDPLVGVVPTAPPVDPTAAPRASRAKPVARPVSRPVTEPVAKPVSRTRPAATPTGKPRAKPVGKTVTKPVTKPVAKPTATPTAVPGPLAGLPATQRQRSTALGYAVAAAARAWAGEPAGPGGWTDVRHVAAAWRDAGGGSLPADRDALVALGTPVALADARTGDLVVYGAPAVPHLGVYLGAGQMVDASPKQGRVVVRPVYAARTVRLVRLG
jgi:cell wall-associated NlpC family hydrolase